MTRWPTLGVKLMGVQCSHDKIGYPNSEDDLGLRHFVDSLVQESSKSLTSLYLKANLNKTGS